MLLSKSCFRQACRLSSLVNRSPAVGPVSSHGYLRQLHVARATWSSDKYPEARVNLGASAGSQDAVTIEGFQGDIHEFSAERAQAVVDRANQEQGLSAEERQASVKQGVQGREETHHNSGNVSLHGVMQDGVPQPSTGSPNQRNMPNHGGVLQPDVRVSGQVHDAHPYRKYSSYPSSGAQGGQDLRGADNLSKSHDHGQGSHGSGHEAEGTSYPDSGPQGGQDLRGTSHFARADQSQGVQGSQVSQLAMMDNPCPQGVQGYECERFKVWLNNCIKHGLKNCDEQLQGIQSGRKTLSEIFAEQDRIIAMATPKRGLHTSSRSYQVSPDQPKPTRKEQLKFYAKEYGWPFMAFYITFSLGCLGCTYCAVASGVDVMALMKTLGLDDKISGTQWAAGASTMAIAYPLYKLSAPIRFGFVVGIFSLFKYVQRMRIVKK